jgi:hypothetical protein
VLYPAAPLVLVWYVRTPNPQPARARGLAREGRATARRFTWERVLRTLLEKIAFLAARQGAFPKPTSQPLDARPATVRRPLIAAA